MTIYRLTGRSAITSVSPAGILRKGMKADDTSRGFRLCEQRRGRGNDLMHDHIHPADARIRLSLGRVSPEMTTDRPLCRFDNRRPAPAARRGPRGTPSPVRRSVRTRRLGCTSCASKATPVAGSSSPRPRRSRSQANACVRAAERLSCVACPRVPTRRVAWARRPYGVGSQPVSHRSGNPTVWSECRCVRKTLRTRDRGIPSCQSRCVAPRPQSTISVSSPASMSVLGPNRSMTGSGRPVPSSVTRIAGSELSAAAETVAFWACSGAATPECQQRPQRSAPPACVRSHRDSLWVSSPAQRWAIMFRRAAGTSRLAG